MSKRNNFFGSKSSYTARTLAFLAATGITDATISAALNTFDLALIAAGLDTKLDALYPLVGGTATTHKFNFMNAADTDAAFRLTFAGGITHNSNGITGNGSTGYADTHFTPSAGGTQYSLNSASFGMYTRTNELGFYCDFGGVNTAAPYPEITNMVRTGSAEYHNINNNEVNGTNPVSDIRKFYILNRSINTTVENYLNGSLLGSYARSSSSLPINSVTLAAYNFSGARYFYSLRNYALFFFGSGLSSTDVTNFTNAVNTFQTSLSRNV